MYATNTLSLLKEWLFYSNMRSPGCAHMVRTFHGISASANIFTSKLSDVEAANTGPVSDENSPEKYTCT